MISHSLLHFRHSDEEAHSTYDDSITTPVVDDSTELAAWGEEWDSYEAMQGAEEEEEVCEGPSISKTVLRSSCTNEEIERMVEDATERANNHPLYGFNRDCSEETQRKIEKGYVRKRLQQHVGVFVPGEHCFIQCGHCGTRVLLQLIKRGKEHHISFGNLVGHCCRRHFSRTAAGDEVIFVFSLFLSPLD